MSPGWTVSDFITFSALAIKVHAAYEDAGEDYRHILEELMALRVLIEKAKRYLKSTPISSDDHQYGQKVLDGCKSALEDLNLFIEKCKRLASTHRRLVFTRFKLCNQDIESLQGRLIPNIVLLKGFVRSCQYRETQEQLAAILTSPRIPITSIASFAANPNTQEAYKQFCNDLYQIGVTEDVVCREENKILDALNSHGMVAGSQDRISGSAKVKPSFRLSSTLNWSHSSFGIGQSSMEPPQMVQNTSLMPEAIGCGDNVARLHQAADKTHFDIVKVLLSTGASLNTDQDKNTLLHCAARDGYVDTIKLLLEKSAPIEAVNNNNDTPLHLAALNNHIGAAEVLLRKGASVEAIGQYGNTPSHLAALSGHTGVVELLLGKGASTESTDVENNTPLHLAAKRGLNRVVEVLVEKGASIEATGIGGNTPLHLAVLGGHTGLVELLVGKGASVETINQVGNIPLISAVQHDYTGVVELLLRSGASTEARPNTNHASLTSAHAPLMSAPARGYNGVVKFLVVRGGSAAIRHYGVTALLVAADGGHTEAAEVLLDNGASTEATEGWSGNTPLHSAAKRGHIRVVEALVRKGALIEATNDEKNTPLHSAAENGHTRVVELLLRGGASFEAANKDKDTPLKLARRLGYVSIVVLLQNKAAEVARVSDGTMEAYLDRGRSRL